MLIGNNLASEILNQFLSILLKKKKNEIDLFFDNKGRVYLLASFNNVSIRKNVGIREQGFRWMVNRRMEAETVRCLRGKRAVTLGYDCDRLLGRTTSSYIEM